MKIVLIHLSYFILSIEITYSYITYLMLLYKHDKILILSFEQVSRVLADFSNYSLFALGLSV